MGRPIRTEPYDLGVAIKAEAWKIVNEQGMNALALRAIARSLNITAPAIYNYFSSHEALLAALVADSDNDLGSYLTEAHTPHLADDASVQFRVVCQAYRRWGIENPQRYMLFFSSKSGQPTGVSPTLQALIFILNTAQKSGGLKKESQLVLPPGLSSLLAEWKLKLEVENEYVLYLAFIVWSRLHGLILNEIGLRYPPYIKNAGELFRLEVKTMIYQYLSE